MMCRVELHRELFCAQREAYERGVGEYLVGTGHMQTPTLKS